MTDIGQYQQIKTMIKTLQGRGYSLDQITRECFGDDVPRQWIRDFIKFDSGEETYYRVTKLEKYVRHAVKESRK